MMRILSLRCTCPCKDHLGHHVHSLSESVPRLYGSAELHVRCRSGSGMRCLVLLGRTTLTTASSASIKVRDGLIFSQRLPYVKFEHCQSMNACLRHAARISVALEYSHMQAWLIGCCLHADNTATYPRCWGVGVGEGAVLAAGASQTLRPFVARLASVLSLGWPCPSYPCHSAPHFCLKRRGWPLPQSVSAVSSGPHVQLAARWGRLPAGEGAPAAAEGPLPPPLPERLQLSCLQLATLLLLIQHPAGRGGHCYSLNQLHRCPEHCGITKFLLAQAAAEHEQLPAELAAAGSAQKILSFPLRHLMSAAGTRRSEGPIWAPTFPTLVRCHRCSRSAGTGNPAGDPNSQASRLKPSPEHPWEPPWARQRPCPAAGACTAIPSGCAAPPRPRSQPPACSQCGPPSAALPRWVLCAAHAGRRLRALHMRSYLCNYLGA